MMKNIKITGLIGILFFLFPASVFALEITVEGNGAGSTQEVNIQNEQTTVVEQSNSGTIENNIDINASSGGNEANENTGENTDITTGDVNVVEEINNSVNSSFVNHKCCDGGEDKVIVSGNGAGSTNTVVSHTSSGAQVTIRQEANINNNSHITADSGNNKANKNNGNISINTGKILVNSKTVNKNINSADVYLAKGGIGVTINIFANGAGSTNKIIFNQNYFDWINIQNSIYLNNNTLVDANSGNNEADGNLGDVIITTGDVKVGVEVENKDINNSKTVIDCCKEDGGKDKNNDDGDTPPTVIPPSGGGGGTMGNGGGGSSKTSDPQVLGITMGQVLPATGTPWFIYMTLANIFTFLFGLYLRLRGGRSPSFVSVYA